MNLLPKIKECPNCHSMNLIRINGITYENKFKSLNKWILKKIFNCRKCKIQLGLFINNHEYKKEKLIWLDLLKCEDSYFDQLNKLEINKLKNKSQNKKYYELLKEITNIQNKIRLDQIKIKVKTKIQNKGLLI